MAESSTATVESGTSSAYTYECMFLVDSSRYASDPQGTIDAVLALVAKVGGEVVAHRTWQDGRLAYEIEGQRKGLHYLVMCEMPGSSVKTLARQVKLSEFILRHLTLRHPRALFDLMVQALTPGSAAEEDEDDSGSADATDADDGADD